MLGLVFINGLLSYLIAFKAEGFDFIENPYLKYLELHVGFRARNYAAYSERPDVDLRKQYLYVQGIKKAVAR
jgi:hypothetical protein